MPKQELVRVALEQEVEADPEVVPLLQQFMQQEDPDLAKLLNQEDTVARLYKALYMFAAYCHEHGVSMDGSKAA